MQRALEAAGDRLFHEARHTSDARTLTDDVNAPQRRADALALVAEAALTADLDRGTAGDRYQVVVHVSAEATTPSMPSTPAPDRTSGFAAGGVLELDHVAHHVSAETSRRISCDASVVTMREAADGTVLDVSRRTRTIPPAIRRALDARDRTCRFPGCTSRRCDAHHIDHWADGGATRLDNLVLLCRRHHRAVHEGGFDLERRADGTVQFYAPDGRPIDTSPQPLRDACIPALTPYPPPPVNDATPLDVAWAIDVLWRPRT